MKEQILELRSKGLSYRDIQKELGCSKATISYYLGEGQKEKSLARTSNYRTSTTEILCPNCHAIEHYIIRKSSSPLA